MTWDNYKIETYVTKMANAVSNYDKKVTELIKCPDKIDAIDIDVIEMDAIDTCQFDKNVISQIFKLQGLGAKKFFPKIRAALCSIFGG